VNKKGKLRAGVVWAIGAVIVMVILAGGLVFLSVGNAPADETKGGGEPVDSGVNVNQIITTSSTLSFSGIDALSNGTSVDVTAYVSKDDQAYKTGVTTANQGDMLAVLFVNDSTYHNAFASSETVSGVDFPVQKNLYKNASVTSKVYSTTGLALLTNGGGANNESALSGGAYTHKITMTGTDKASTQDMVCVLEASDKTKAKEMKLTGFGAVKEGDVPQAYTPSATTSEMWVYTVKPIADASLQEGSIYLSSEDGQSMTGKTAKITCYTKEYFIDPLTGDVMYDIENEQGTLQSMATYTYSWVYT